MNYQVTKKPKKGQKPLTQIVDEETYLSLKNSGKLGEYEVMPVEHIRVKEPKEIKPKQ